jgi:hypothetical protein
MSYLARVKLDISANETVVRPPVLREIGHPYPDQLPGRGRVRCYSFEELFAEKLRAMGQRGRPRDLYDIVNLFRRTDLQAYPDLIREVLAEKCQVKGIAVPTAADFAGSPLLAELESEWGNMLGHQLPALPPLAPFLDELPTLFGWLEGTIVIEQLPLTPYAPGEDENWSPPATVATWRTGVPLEAVQFRCHQPPARRASLPGPLASYRALRAPAVPDGAAAAACRAGRRNRAPQLRHRCDRGHPRHHHAVPPPHRDRVLRPPAAFCVAPAPQTR